MKKEENAFIKVLIILVIASLALLAIVYLMMKADKEVPQDPIAYPIKLLPIEPFDNLGRLVVGEDIGYNDPDWEEKCQGSEWKKGELFGITYTYTNLKYGYSLDVVYKPFYNDDLIVYPFSNNQYVDTFEYNATVIEDEEGNYKLPCGPHGPVPGFSLEVEEAKTVSEIKEDVMTNNIPGLDPEFKEIAVGQWDAVSYWTTGYMQYQHIILLGNEYNYHFTATEGNEEQFLDMVKSFELLSEEKTTKKLDDLLTVAEARDRDMVDVNFEALCEGSDWVLGEKKEDWFWNEKYGYKVKYKYQEFYNDDLKKSPYYITSDSRSFSVGPPRFSVNEEEDCPCLPIGSEHISITVKEVQSPEKILEEVKESMSFNPEFNIDFQEVTFDNGWEAVTYKTSGYDPLYHNVVLLGDDYNYHFFAFKGLYDELLDMVKSFELLSEEKTTKKLDDLLTVEEARNMVDVNFEALCEVSDWVFGEKKEDWFWNEKYGYKVKYKYQEFYNDDLKQFPYSITSDSRSFSVYPPRFLGNEEEGYSYPCQPIGGGDYMSITVEEVQSPEKILEEVKEGMSFNPEFNIDFQEVTFDNGWEAVTYKTSGYGPLYHNVVLLGDDYNYHFFASKERYDELLEMVNSFELFQYYLQLGL